MSGFNGSVIPPPWVTEHDRRPEWIPKVRDQLAFVFCHGDLGPQNLMCDPETLEIRWVIDWENAGFYDEEFLHLWAVDSNHYYDLYKNKDQLASLVTLLEQ